MGFYAFFFLALIGTAAAAPWRCYRTSDGSTVCFGEMGQPVINPPSICINRPAQPCSGSATVFTPPCNPCAPSNPCNSFVPCNSCPPLQPCDPLNPCNQCDSCVPCNPCEPGNPCLY